MKIPDKLIFRIGDVSKILGVEPHVLRYWELEFPNLKPPKNPNGYRNYSKQDVENFAVIQHLLYLERYSIEGARNKIAQLKTVGEFKVFRSKLMAKLMANLDSNVLENSPVTGNALRVVLEEEENEPHQAETELFRW